MPAWLGSVESSLPGLQTAAFSLCLHMVREREREKEREIHTERDRRREISFSSYRATILLD